MVRRKSVLITGCSQGGLGDALARALHGHGGYRVFASARDPSKITHLTALGIETVTLDVLSRRSIEAAAEHISRLTNGRLDILINNSGQGCMMPILDANLDHVRATYELNVLSNISVIQVFFPLLRAAAPGSMIVNNTSAASAITVPCQGLYAGTKAAMALITDALRGEMKPFGITVVELKTGNVRSKLFENAHRGQGSGSLGETSRVRLPADSVYQPVREAVERGINGVDMQRGAQDQDVWAVSIVRQLSKKRVPARIWRGGSSFLAWFLRTFFWHTFPDLLVQRMAGLAHWVAPLTPPQQK